MSTPVVVDLPHNFKPWYHQLDAWNAMVNASIKRMLLVWHRRAGKDILAFNILILKAMERVGTYWIVFPEYSHGRKIIWEGQTDSGRKFIDFIPPELIARKRDDTMFIELINGSIIKIVGSDAADSLVGTNPVGVIFSEYSIQNPRAWNLVRPILNANNGWAIFVYTPRGYNHGHDLYLAALDQAEKNPDKWFCQLLTIDHTSKILVDDNGQYKTDENGDYIWGPIVTPEMIAEDLATGMAPELIDQEYHCFKNDAPILTNLGLLPIEQVKIGDLVLTHKNRWKPVKDIITRKYIGKLIKIKSYGNGEDILCTPEHPIRIIDKATQTYSWVQAKKIKIGDRVTFPRLNLGKISIIQKELAQLIGWFISEGSIANNQVNFSLNITEDFYAQEIQGLLNNLGYESKIYKNYKGNSQTVVVNSVELQEFLINHCGCGAKYKKIPLSLIKGFELEVFNTLLKGDGCIKDNSSHKRQHLFGYGTVSKTLAYQIQVLAHSLGYTAGITKKISSPSIIEGRHIKPGEYWMVQMNKPENTTKMGIHKYSISGYVKDVSIEKYTGLVYNLSILHDESYTAYGRVVHNCSFDAALVGSYYGDQISTARKNNRICTVPYVPAQPVHTAWDLGKSDATAIWFFQRINDEYRWIDYKEWKGKSFQEILKAVKELPYVYGSHLGPHDIKVADYTSKESRWTIAKNLGVPFIIVPKLSIQDGIDAVRRIIPNSYFDSEKCSQGISCLSQYQKTWNETLKQYSDAPLHNWCSHGADAFRTAAVGMHFIRDNLTDTFNPPGVSYSNYNVYSHAGGFEDGYIAPSDYNIISG